MGGRAFLPRLVWVRTASLRPSPSRSYIITINVAQVPRPPVIFPQNRSIAESATPFTALPPALIASQPQGLSLNYSVTPATVFGIGQKTGLLFLQVRVLS